MPKRRIKLEGPGAQGVVVNAALLRDLLVLILDGSQKALRLRTQGRSTARGTLPQWISTATDFSLTILAGSTILELEAPTLFESDPETFRQGTMFPEVDPQLTGLDYLSESIDAATEHNDRATLYDKPLLELFASFAAVFNHGIEAISFDGMTLQSPECVRIEPDNLDRIAKLELSIPEPQEVSVAGKLDSIRHSDRTFVMVLPGTGERLKGIAEPELLHRMKDLWGKEVLISGAAHFAANSKILRIEATALTSASEEDLQLWAFSPQPLSTSIPQTTIRVAQHVRNGLNAIIGQWPGSETDEDIAKALEQLS